VANVRKAAQKNIDISQCRLVATEFKVGNMLEIGRQRR